MTSLEWWLVRSHHSHHSQKGRWGASLFRLLCTWLIVIQPVVQFEEGIRPIMTPRDPSPIAGNGSEGSDEPQRLATPDLEDAQWWNVAALGLRKSVGETPTIRIGGSQSSKYMGLKWFESSWISKMIPKMALKQPQMGVNQPNIVLFSSNPILLTSPSNMDKHGQTWDKHCPRTLKVSTSKQIVVGRYSSLMVASWCWHILPLYVSLRNESWPTQKWWCEL